MSCLVSQVTDFEPDIAYSSSIRLQIYFCLVPRAGLDWSAYEAGADKKVVMLSLPGLHESTSRWKPLPKGSVDAMAACSCSSESQILAVSGERATVWSLYVLTFGTLTLFSNT